MNVEYNVFQTKKDKTTRMMISPAHFDEVVKHSPLRVLKSYDSCEQVMCRRARLGILRGKGQRPFFFYFFIRKFVFYNGNTYIEWLYVIVGSS